MKKILALCALCMLTVVGTAQAIELPKGLQGQQLTEWEVTSKSIPGTTLRLVFVKAPFRHKGQMQDPSTGKMVTTGTVFDSDIFDQRLWKMQVNQESFAKGLEPAAAYLSAICAGNVREVTCRTAEDALRIPLDSGDTVMIPVATVETTQLDAVVRELTYHQKKYQEVISKKSPVQKKVVKATIKKPVAQKVSDNFTFLPLDLEKVK